MKVDNIFIVAIYCLLMFSCEKAVNNEDKVVYPSDMLNEFKFSLNQSNKILSFINPDCEHCQYQTGALLGNYDAKPADLRLAFLSDVHPDSLRAFASQFAYDTTTTVFLWDEGGKIAQQLGVSSYPTMFLYDTAGVHLETIVGEAKPGYVYKFFHASH